MMTRVLFTANTVLGPVLVIACKAPAGWCGKPEPGRKPQLKHTLTEPRVEYRALQKAGSAGGSLGLSLSFLRGGV
jgi:hypothetical protein